MSAWRERSPYCQGWEIQDRRWGYLGRAADASHLLTFALQTRGWTRDLVVFTNGAFVPDPQRERLQTAGVRDALAAPDRDSGL